MKPGSRSRFIIRTLFIPVGMLICLTTAAQDSEAQLSHGKYILQISGCTHCHTADGGDELSGGRALQTPFGTFFSPNITADLEHGIGSWSEDDFKNALRNGRSPRGHAYYPAFPYTSYSGMLDADISALYTYIFSLPTSARINREHELSWYLQWRLPARLWQWLFFSPGEFEDNSEQSSSWNRGAYLASALAHCSECHTPRNAMGAIQQDLNYAGNPEGPEGEKVPNITSSKSSGIGDWSHSNLVDFFRFGELPDGEYASGTMEPVLEGLANLTEVDRNALIEFLNSVPPIENGNL